MDQTLYRYLSCAWMLKLRLMASRQILWSSEWSLFHFERSCLHIRKICEGIAFLSLIASEIEFGELPKRVQKQWNAADLLKLHQRKGQLRFPRFARFSRINSESETPGKFSLTIDDLNSSDLQRFLKIYVQMGNFLHEPSPKLGIFSSSDLRQLLSKNLVALRADHQWLWNRIWQHANMYGSNLFFVELGDTSAASAPLIIKSDGLSLPDVSPKIDVEAIIDHATEVDWAKFQG